MPRDLTYADVLLRLSISPVQQRLVLCQIFKLDWDQIQGSTTTVPANQLSALWVAELLERISFMKAEQRQLVLQMLVATPAFRQLAFADGRYVTATFWSRWLDLETGQEVDEVPRPLETISYNLCTLYWRKLDEYTEAIEETQPSTK